MSEQIKFGENTFFRYRAFNERSLEAFRNDKLFFSTPKHFNDPFDTLAYIDTGKLFSSIGSDLNHMQSYLGTQISQNNHVPFPLVTDENKDFLLKFSEDPENRKEFYAFVAKQADLLKEKILANSKIICFSKEWLSMLMWSHYADYHRGFALGYSVDSLTSASLFDEKDNPVSQALTFLPVNYTENKPDMGEWFYNDLPKVYMGNAKISRNPFYLDLLKTKSPEWAYEKEYRLCSLPDDFEKTDPVTYAKATPTVLFLGAKMEDKNRWELFKIAKKKKIAVFEVWTNETAPKYKLNFCKFDSRTLKKSYIL
ncbi:MAG: DUF2971 domain-containing protein [Eubacterium sp.]|jgi:Protein of unknown function (DUF2971).|nr:DUF2971 domain-containing protein [Eubacterium sp.]